MQGTNRLERNPTQNGRDGEAWGCSVVPHPGPGAGVVVVVVVALAEVPAVPGPLRQRGLPLQLCVVTLQPAHTLLKLHHLGEHKGHHPLAVTLALLQRQQEDWFELID